MAETSSAAASISTAANPKYDVFLNHRGPDVKKHFASHLYRRLISYGLRVFLDQPELERGDYFLPQITDAIRSASVHVAIFSEGYADSSWCLNELLEMLDSKAPIIPVFYKVKPTELRWTRGKKRTHAETLEEVGRNTEDDGQIHEEKLAKGKKRTYAEALKELERKTERDPQTQEEKLRYHSTLIENWRNALSQVAEISGFELEACNGDEGELLDKVVEVVLEKVRKSALPLDVAKYPTGLDDKVKEFENTVFFQRQQSRKPHIMGIVGLGGVGKTTIAKEIFNRKNSDYNSSCFVFNVRDNAGKGGLVPSQKKLLKSLNVRDDTIERVDGVDEGKVMLRNHLSSAKVLLILDDVDHMDQVDSLLPDQTVGSDSIILITSRNKDVLIGSGVEESSIYNLNGLTKQHSRELFCLHSFSRPHPPPDFESLVEKFVEACGGLPLSLKVFGALLHGKNTSYWECHLNKLRCILPHEIKKRLQISYDALDREEQEIFLDIACFFIGEDRDMAVRIWDNGVCGFRNIQDKCLIEVNYANEIQMHDHLRDMGREIARASELPRRLWSWTEKDIDNLSQQSSVTPVRGIRLLLSQYNDIDGDDLMGGISMRRLQLLDTQAHILERILTKVQWPNLKWLRWKECPYSSLPSYISMKNLRVLQLQGSKLQTLWENESQELPLQLRQLQVNRPLSNVPKSIGQLKLLEQIVINLPYPTPEESLCYEVYLMKLPEEFCELQSLKELVINYCSELKSLPECFGNLTNLHNIELTGCQALERLPESFGNLTNLHNINLSYFSALKRLPESFVNLIYLQHINLSYCSALELLSESFGNLTDLQNILLIGCRALKRLPDSFCKLIKLQRLFLNDCINWTWSSDTLGNINTLEYINLSGCEKIEGFLHQVANQRSVKQLLLGGTNLKELPDAIGELRDLEVLDVSSHLLDTLPPSICGLMKLKILELDGCTALKCLPVLLGLSTQLTELRVAGCTMTRELPFKKEVKGERETLSNSASSIDNWTLPRLQRLHVSETGISEVSFAEGVFCNLRYLCIERCNNLVEVGALPNTLIDLSLRDCIKLEELPHIEKLLSLEWLAVTRCVKLKSIRGLGQLTQLRRITVYSCSELEDVEGIQHCMSLFSIKTVGCPKLQWSAGVVEQLHQRRIYITFINDYWRGSSPHYP